jgi:hypothetical protein
MFLVSRDERRRRYVTLIEGDLLRQLLFRWVTANNRKDGRIVG